MLNVLIVEPHDIARTGLRQILKDSRLARQIEAVPDLSGNPGLLDQREWDVLLFSVESASGDEFKRPPQQMRGAARDFEVPRDFRTPEALRPYTTH